MAVKFINIVLYVVTMVSNLYEAKTFYDMQRKGKVAKGFPVSQKLRKKGDDFYLTKSKPNGDKYKQKVNNNDLVYARNKSQGVTKYSTARDRKINSGGVQENLKQHSKHAHMGDREAKSGRKYRI